MRSWNEQSVSFEVAAPVSFIVKETTNLEGRWIDQGKVVRVTDSVVFDASAYREMTERIIQHLKDQGNITVAEARTMFDTSRKYILPLLEHMDQQQITRRTGDERVLR